MQSKLFRIFLVLLLVACFAMTCSAAVPERALSPLSLTMAIPIRTLSPDEPGNLRYIHFNQDDLDFYVVLTNVSSKSVRIWDSLCRLGFGCIKFEITNVATGETRIVSKLPVESYSFNSPLVAVLEPGEAYVYRIRLSDYESFGGTAMTIKIRAIYQVEPDSVSKKMQAWTGKVYSAVHEYQVRDIVFKYKTRKLEE